MQWFSCTPRHDKQTDKRQQQRAEAEVTHKEHFPVAPEIAAEEEATIARACTCRGEVAEIGLLEWDGELGDQIRVAEVRILDAHVLLAEVCRVAAAF